MCIERNRDILFGVGRKAALRDTFVTAIPAAAGLVHSHLTLRTLARPVWGRVNHFPMGGREAETRVVSKIRWAIRAREPLNVQE